MQIGRLEDFLSRLHTFTRSATSAAAFSSRSRRNLGETWLAGKNETLGKSADLELGNHSSSASMWNLRNIKRLQFYQLVVCFFLVHEIVGIVGWCTTFLPPRSPLIHPSQEWTSADWYSYSTNNRPTGRLDWPNRHSHYGRFHNYGGYEIYNTLIISDHLIISYEFISLVHI